MKQFTKDELAKLKCDVIECLKRDDSYKNLIAAYYTSFDVLLYLNFSEEGEISQTDLQFWRDAIERAVEKAVKLDEEIGELFTEMLSFEYSVSYAGYVKTVMYPDNEEITTAVHEKLLSEREERKEYYRYLRQLAGIYLDILSEDVKDESYLNCLWVYNSISLLLDEPERGFGEDDEYRLSLGEVEMILEKLEKLRKIEEQSVCPYAHNHISEQIYYFTVLKKELKRMSADETEEYDENVEDPEDSQPE